jgi:hypothetical protein
LIHKTPHSKNSPERDPRLVKGRRIKSPNFELALEVWQLDFWSNPHMCKVIQMWKVIDLGYILTVLTFPVTLSVSFPLFIDFSSRPRKIINPKESSL